MERRRKNKNTARTKSTTWPNPPPVPVSCSVLQCVAVCCSALQCVAVCCVRERMCVCWRENARRENMNVEENACAGGSVWKREGAWHHIKDFIKLHSDEKEKASAILAPCHNASHSCTDVCANVHLCVLRVARVQCVRSGGACVQCVRLGCVHTCVCVCVHT